MPPGIHGHHPETIPEFFGHRGPQGSTKTVGVVEQCQGPISPPILEGDLDPPALERDTPADDVIGNKNCALGDHLDHSPWNGPGPGKPPTRYAQAMSAARFHMDDRFRRRIVANLDGFERLPLSDPGLIPAAVTLLLLGDKRNEACFVLTRRASRMRDHAGQWALPGGRMDPGESAIEAALRETEEEVGLSLPSESVIGLLDDYPTRSGFLITPVVVWADANPSLSPNPDEVAEIHRIPLEVLEHPTVPRLREIPESDRPVLSVPISSLGADIHAPTAAFLYQLREVGLRGKSTRVAHYEQPVFAWR